MIGVADSLFVDTNILVYASVPRAPMHGEAVTAVRTHARAGTELWISRQVIREFLATLSRPQPFGRHVPGVLLAAQARLLEREFAIAEDGPETTAHLLTLIERVPVGGKQVHDANIVATMQAHGIRRLLTANTADFARYAGLIAVIPV